MDDFRKGSKEWGSKARKEENPKCRVKLKRQMSELLALAEADAVVEKTTKTELNMVDINQKEGMLLNMNTNKQHFGTVQHEGKTITLTQDAYADCNVGTNAWFADREPIYRANGIDADGNEYRVTWSVTGDIDGADASNACDWSSPTLIEAR